MVWQRQPLSWATEWINLIGCFVSFSLSFRFCSANCGKCTHRNDDASGKSEAKARCSCSLLFDCIRRSTEEYFLMKILMPQTMLWNNSIVHKCALDKIAFNILRRYSIWLLQNSAQLTTRNSSRSFLMKTMTMKENDNDIWHRHSYISIMCWAIIIRMTIKLPFR